LPSFESEGPGYRRALGDAEPVYQERGYCHMSLRDATLAIEAFLEAVNLNPALAAEQVSMLEELPPEIVRAGSLFSNDQLSAAENILREYWDILDQDGNQDVNHVEAMRLLARIEHQSHALEDAEQRLETVLKRAPNYRAARLDYVRILLDQQKYLRAHEVIDTMLRLDPDDKKSSFTVCSRMRRTRTKRKGD